MIKEPGDEVNILSKRVIGIAIDVHRALGPGYTESIYEKALCMEFDSIGMPYVNQLPIEVVYKDSIVGEGRIDFLIEGKLIVEIKSVGSLAPIHITQLRSYLKATGMELGLLINFNETRLADGIRRVVFTSRSRD